MCWIGLLIAAGAASTSPTLPRVHGSICFRRVALFSISTKQSGKIRIKLSEGLRFSEELGAGKGFIYFNEVAAAADFSEKNAHATEKYVDAGITQHFRGERRISPVDSMGATSDATSCKY